MNTFTKNLYAMIAVGLVSGSISAKDLYIAADGNDSNTGTSASSPRATLTGLNDIIAAGDIIHVSGMIDVSKEISLSDNITDNKQTWGHWFTTADGKQTGFYLNGSNNPANSPWKGVTFEGEDPENDGFDGNDATRIFYVRGDNKTTFTFKNLSFRNGLAPKEGAGAIFIHDNGWVNIENCVFEQNHLDYAPLTEEVQSSGFIKLKNSTSERGGAVYMQTGRLNITDTRFSDNHNRRGGALIATGGTLKVSRCQFEGNGADIDGKYLDDSRGGAVHLWPLNVEISASFDHCDFVDNTTWNNSGALFLQDNVDSGHLLDAVFTNCSFVGNKTVDGQGGAVVVANAENAGAKDDRLKNIYATFANTSFLFNESKSEGGAIYMNGGLTGDELRLVNCTLAKNLTQGNAGHGAGYAEGIANDTFKPEDADRYFYNCLVEQNEAPSAASGKGEYSDLLPYGYFATDHSYYGRIMFTKIDETAFYDGLTIAGIDKENVWHGNHIYNFGDEKNVLLLSDDAVNGYDWSGGSFKFMTLSSGAEELENGDPQYLTRASRTVTASNGKEFTLQGYDISASDQMGFARKNGKCAIGAMEVSTEDVEDYYDGRDFPYLEEDGATGIESVISDSAVIGYANGIATAAGARITVYSVQGVVVAAADNVVNLSHLANGVYIIKATGNGVDTTIKVVR